ncbi:MAG: hypothetical protein HQL50_13770, partial [Magnetococcales bacterium]|nr:hypothetical protein [Magnetococcales bacterium]
HPLHLRCSTRDIAFHVTLDLPETERNYVSGELVPRIRAHMAQASLRNPGYFRMKMQASSSFRTRLTGVVLALVIVVAGGAFALDKYGILSDPESMLTAAAPPSHSEEESASPLTTMAVGAVTILSKSVPPDVSSKLVQEIGRAVPADAQEAMINSIGTSIPENMQQQVVQQMIDMPDGSREQMLNSLATMPDGDRNDMLAQIGSAPKGTQQQMLDSLAQQRNALPQVASTPKGATAKSQGVSKNHAPTSAASLGDQAAITPQAPARSQNQPSSESSRRPLSSLSKEMDGGTVTPAAARPDMNRAGDLSTQDPRGVSHVPASTTASSSPSDMARVQPQQSQQQLSDTQKADTDTWQPPPRLFPRSRMTAQSAILPHALPDGLALLSLADYRKLYPQFAHIKDDRLFAERIHTAFYGWNIPASLFFNHLGLNDGS